MLTLICKLVVKTTSVGELYYGQLEIAGYVKNLPKAKPLHEIQKNGLAGFITKMIKMYT